MGLSDELIQGEAILTLGPNGDVLRIVDLVVLLLKKGPEDAYLIEEEVSIKGETRTLCRLPGAKKRPDDNHFNVALRVLKKQLRIDENHIDIDNDDVRILEEEKESLAFPGIQTIYRKRIIHCNL